MNEEFLHPLKRGPVTLIAAHKIKRLANDFWWFDVKETTMKRSFVED
jgi:hypothetical protein